jgi:hypothetical protein
VSLGQFAPGLAAEAPARQSMVRFQLSAKLLTMVSTRLGKSVVLAVATTLLGTASGFAAVGLQFSVYFIVVEVEVSPHQDIHRTHKRWLFTISKNGDLVAGDKKRHLGVQKIDTDEKGETFSISYKVNNNSVIMDSKNSGFEVITDIVTNQKDSCEASITYLKTSGHEYYEGNRNWNKEHMLMSEMRAEAVACSVTEVQE